MSSLQPSLGRRGQAVLSPDRHSQPGEVEPRQVELQEIWALGRKQSGLEKHSTGVNIVKRSRSVPISFHTFNLIRVIVWLVIQRILLIENVIISTS